MKLTVVGCSGSFPSAESACSSYLVEADGFRLLLDMGNGALGELQRHCGLYDLDADPLSHLHRRPLHRHVRVLRRPLLPARRRPRRRRSPSTAPRAPSGGWPAPTTTCRDEKCMSEVFDFRTLTAGHLRDRPLHGPRRPRLPPGGGIRHPHRARRPLADLLGRHRSVRRAGRARRGTPTSSSARPRSPTARRTSRSCTSTAGRPASTRSGRAPAHCCSPTSRRGPTRRPTARRAGGLRRPGGTGQGRRGLRAGGGARLRRRRWADRVPAAHPPRTAAARTQDPPARPVRTFRTPGRIPVTRRRGRTTRGYPMRITRGIAVGPGNGSGYGQQG